MVVTDTQATIPLFCIFVKAPLPRGMRQTGHYIPGSAPAAQIFRMGRRGTGRMSFTGAVSGNGTGPIGSPFSGSSRQTGFRHSASFGQFLTHSMHRMHSVPFSRFLELSVTSTFIGHTRLHFPQEMHFSLSHFTRIREK